MISAPRLILCSEGMAPLVHRIQERLRQIGEPIRAATVNYIAFANGEGKPMIPVTVRRQEVYLFWELHPNPNEQLMRLYLTIKALHRASVDRIFLVLPYLPYMRQDRKAEGREPISARDVADMLELCDSVKNVMTMDFHADQEQGFFSRPADNLPGALVFARYFRERYAGNYRSLVVISTDDGGLPRARRFADMIDGAVKVYNFGKRRPRANEAEITYFTGEGEVDGKDAVYIDDLIDTAKSLQASVTVGKQQGIRQTYIAATHGVFSPSRDKGSDPLSLPRSAEERLKALGAEVFITESIPRDQEYCARNSEWLTVLPLDELLSEALYQSMRSDNDASLSAIIKAWSSPDHR